MLSFRIHSASNRFASNGVVRMRGLLHPINIEGTSTVGNLGRASRPNHPERGAFTASAICRQGVVPVRMRGRLAIRRTETTEVWEVPAHASVPPFEPLPVQSSPSAGLLARRLRRILAALPVFLLRLSQLPLLGREPRLIESLGAFQAPRSPTLARVHAAKQTSRGFTKCFQVLSSLVCHGSNHGRRMGQGVVRE